MRKVRNPQIVLPIGQTAKQGALARRTLGIAKQFGMGTEICGEGEPLDFIYEVEKGAVRTVKILSDGRRKIGGFYFAGDIFGLEDGNEHALSAEAVVPSSIRVIKRQTLVRLAADHRKVAEELLTMAMREAARAQHHTLMLVLSAQERVNDFLVEMTQRISVGDLVHLPMARQDIADYLGLTIETVSREIRSLAGKTTIYLPSLRQIVVRDRPALKRGTGTEVSIVV
jgi:CRP/FNR family nitrogen fixation transcriptional regulator